MLKIRRSGDVGSVVLALSGRIAPDNVPELQRAIETEGDPVGVTLDLQEVRLVDRDAVRFLAACEAQGIKLRSCPPYIRQWIETGRNRDHEFRR